MMKKWFALLLAIAMLSPLMPTLAEQGQTYTLQGLITEVDSGYFVMDDETRGDVRVNLDDAITAYDGIAAKDKLTVGLYVFVQYNGIMTRSLPPQVTALKVGCYVVIGTVSDILTYGYIVEGDTVIGKVIVHMDDSLPPVYKGVPITLYYDGIMALSMPPQISAAYIIVPVLEGVISGASKDGFILTDDSGKAHQIALSDETRVLTLPAEGERVRVYYSGVLTNDTDATALEVSTANVKDAGNIQE